MTTKKERKKVQAIYIGPGAYFPGQGDKATGDTVEVWDDELATRWDLDKAPAKPATKSKTK